MNNLDGPLSFAVSALLEKRREMAKRIEHLQSETRKVVADLDHIEAALRIVKPDLDFQELLPRPVPPPHAAFKGEVSRILLDELRKTTRPLSTRHLTLILMHERGLNADDPKLVRLMQQRVGSCLNHWKRRGYLSASPAQDLKGMLLWEILEDPQRFTSYDVRLLADDAEARVRPAPAKV